MLATLAILLQGHCRFTSEYTGRLFGCIWHWWQTPHFSRLSCVFLGLWKKHCAICKSMNVYDWIGLHTRHDRAISKLGTEVQLHGGRNRCCGNPTHILLPLPLSHSLPDFNCSTYISLPEVFQRGCTTVHIRQQCLEFQLPLISVSTCNCQVLFFRPF